MMVRPIFTVIATAFLLFGCGSEKETNDGRKIVNIGHVGPLTGPISHLGKDNERGASLAVD